MKRSQRRAKAPKTAIERIEPRCLLSVTPVITTLDGVAHANGSTISVQAGVALQVRAVNNLTVDNTNTSYALSGGSVFTGASNPNNTRFSWNFGDTNAVTDPDYTSGVRTSYPTLVGFNAAHVYDLRTAGTTDYKLTLTATDQAGNVTTCTVTVAVTDGPLSANSPAAEMGSSASDVESEPIYNGVTYDRIIFVDSVNGSDSYSGFAPTYTGGTTGPVASFGKAISMIDATGASNWQIRFARGETFDVTYGNIPSGGLNTQNVIFGAYGNTSLARPVLDYDFTGANANAGGIFTAGPNAANWTIQDINLGNISTTAYAETANGTVLAPQGSNITMRDCSYVGNFSSGIITTGSDAIDGLLLQDVNDNGHWFDGPATESNGSFTGSGGYEIALGLGAGAINDVVMVGNTFTGASLNPQEVEGSDGGDGHQPFIRIQPTLDDANGVYASGGRFLLADNVIEPQNCNSSCLTFKGFSYFVYWTGNTFENGVANFGDDLENQIANGSFDDSTPLSSWTVVTPTVTVETSGAENGTNDVQLSGSAELDQTLTNDFNEDATYDFSAYVEASSASSLELGVKNFSGGAGNTYTTVVPGKSWEYVSIPFTLGPTDKSATVYLKNVGSNPVLVDNTSINQSTYNNIWCVVDGNRAVGVSTLDFRNDELHLTYRNNVVERYSDSGPASFQESNGYGTVNSTGEGTEDLQLIDNTIYSSYSGSGSVNKLIDLHSDSAVQQVSIVGNLLVEPNVTTNNYQPAINLYSTAAPWLLQDNSNVLEDPSNNGGLNLVGVGASDTPQSLATWNGSGAGERPTVNSSYASSAYNDTAVNVTIANDASAATSTAALNVTSANADIAVPFVSTASTAYDGAQWDFYGNPRPLTGTWTAGAVQSLVEDSGFEETSLQTGALSSSTHPWAGYGNATIAADSSSHGGANDMQLTPHATTGSGASQVISNLVPNTTYVLTGWFKVQSAGDSIAVSVNSYNNSLTSSTSVHSMTWTQGSITFTTGLTNTSATITVSDPALTGTDKTYADDFYLAESSYGMFSTDLDIGSPTPAGSASFSSPNSTYTVSGGGADIWGTSDQFNYLYTTFDTNGSITGLVPSQTNTNNFAQAGVMIRNDSSASAALAEVAVTPDNIVTFRYRATAGASVGQTYLSGIAGPLWVKLTRTGNSFSAYYSSNDVNWIQIGSAETVTIATSALAGLCVTSHDQGTICTATFTGVSLIPSWLSASSLAAWNPTSDVLTVTGSSSIVGDPGADEPVVLANGASAELTVAPTVSDQDIHLGGVMLINGAELSMASVGSSRSHGNHNVLVLGTLGAITSPTFSIDSASKLDLQDNDLIVHDGNLAAMQSELAVGRNVAAGGVANGTWNGNGLTSSIAAADDGSAGSNSEEFVLGCGLNSALPFPLSNWTVGSAVEPLRADGQDVLVKFTYNGDFNLDGSVNRQDAAIINANFNPSHTFSTAQFVNGDTNGDGFVDRKDTTAFNAYYLDGTATGHFTAQL
jgi:hypothetical protein